MMKYADALRDHLGLVVGAPAARLLPLGGALHTRRERFPARPKTAGLTAMIEEGPGTRG